VQSVVKTTSRALRNSASSVTVSIVKFASLQHNLRTLKDRSQNDLTACRNYANSTTELFIAINEFAGKTAAEADGHALDKKACYDAWPK